MSRTGAGAGGIDVWRNEAAVAAGAWAIDDAVKVANFILDRDERGRTCAWPNEAAAAAAGALDEVAMVNFACDGGSGGIVAWLEAESVSLVGEDLATGETT